MKFPFVLRSRLQAKMAPDPNQHAQLTELRREMEALHSHLREMERICEIRRVEIEQLKEVEKLCERRARQIEQFKEVEKLCERRAQEIATMRSEKTLADYTHRLLLEELTAARQALLPEGGVPTDPRGPLPLVFAVDLEPDLREVNRQDPSWRASAEFFRRLPELRQRINAIAGDPIVFTWLVRADPQIEISNGDMAYAFHHFADELRAATEAGDEIGLHVHPWRWEESLGRWMQDHANDEWINHCLEVSCDTYRRHFGKVPASHSSGDRFMSNAIVRKLEEIGVKVDLSLERLPGAERLVSYELDTGSIPDTSRVPNRAYRPSAEDFRQPDPSRRDGVGLMPLTAYPGGHLFAWTPPAIFEQALELTLMDRTSLTHLAFVVRTDLALSPSWDQFVANVEALARRVKEGTLQFSTAENAWESARKWLDEQAVR